MSSASIPRQVLDRRHFLSAGVAAGLSAVSPWPAPGMTPGKESQKTRRVVFVAFAGGVRTRETLGTPANVPNLARMASEGVVYPRVRAKNLGHFGATLSLFTGVSEARGIRENARGPDPTFFEYVRKELGLPATEAWLSTSGGAQQSNYAASYHSDYGARYGANTLDGDGIFNSEFRGLLDSLGRPRELADDEAKVLSRLRKAMKNGTSSEDEEGLRRVERYILDELRGGTTDLRGTGAPDAKALRIARNLLSVFQPTLLGVVLRNADIAHRNFNAYVEVVRRNDSMLGELWDVIRSDAELRDSTAVFVLPEFGRDADLNTRRGLDHGDGSDDLNYVSLICWGPDFARGRVVRESVRTTDVCPTICDLLGARAPLARGKRLPKLQV